MIEQAGRPIAIDLKVQTMKWNPVVGISPLG